MPVDQVDIIDGRGSGPKRWRRRTLGESEQITCWKCEAETGVATSTTIEVTLAPRRGPGGKVVGGTRILACAICLARGETVELAVEPQQVILGESEAADRRLGF